MKKFLLNFFVYLTCLFIFFNLQYSYFYEIYMAEHLIFPYAIHPFDICELYPQTWIFIKKSYCILFVLAYSIIHFNIVYRISSFIKSRNLDFSKIFKFSPKFKLHKSKHKKSISNVKENDTLSLKIGLSANNESIFVSEKGLFQNILITGTIGSGKTSSAMYPFTRQLITYKANIPNEKLGMLILDVKRKLCKRGTKICNIMW